MLNIARMSRVLTIAALITLSCHLSSTISSNGPLVALSRRVRRQVAITDTTDVWVARGDEAIELRVHTVFLATDATWVYTDMHMPVMEEILKGFLEIPIETLKRTLVAYEMRELESKDQYRKWFYTQVASVLAPHITTQHNILTCTGSISKAEISRAPMGRWSSVAIGTRVCRSIWYTVASQMVVSLAISHQNLTRIEPREMRLLRQPIGLHTCVIDAFL